MIRLPRAKNKTTVQAEVQEKVQSVQKMFSKEQILASARYHNRRDLVDALLDEDKSYTIEEVDNAISKFMKG